MKATALSYLLLSVLALCISSCSNIMTLGGLFAPPEPVVQPTQPPVAITPTRRPQLTPYAPAPGTKIKWNSGRSDQPIIALTFDDGPHPQNTPRLLDILNRYGVKATFFTVGRNVDMYPQIVQRIIAEGHEIGNHTYTHGNLSKMGAAGVRQELNRGRDAIARAANYQPRVMRPPYGALTPEQRNWIYYEYGYPTILWNVDPYDWRDRVPSTVASRLVSGARPGGILLAHDLHKTTVDAIPSTLEQLLAQGYQFITVSELIARSTTSTL